jgi:SAM-dependent methyltransferase
MADMGTTPSDTYLHPYRQAVGRVGHGFEVTLWANPDSQRRRFEVMAQMCDVTDKRVLDAGCSRGDFARFLLDAGHTYQQFVGLDALGEVIDHARQRHLPRAAFYCKDFVTYPEALALDEPQVVAISGSLNTMDNRTALSVLEAAWEAAGETLIFNFLSDRTGPRAQPQAPPVHRLPTMELLAWAMRKTWAVQFRQDYFDQGHDATIRMDKSNP